MKKAVMKLVEFSVNKPRLVVFLMLVLTILFGMQFIKIKIDTDPENMLAKDEPIRVFHNQVKKDFDINEMIVLGIVRDDGIFHPETLKRISSITDEVMRIKGVIADDVASLTVTNNVVARDGTLNVRPPMYKLPENQAEIDELKKEVLGNPLFKDRLVASDGKGTAIHIPIEDKDLAHDIGEKIKEIYKKEKGQERYYMAGLPIAEDTFGYEMFIQMGIVAPMAGAVLMIVMFIIFRSFMFIIPAMAVAMVSVMWTMGAMIGLGFTVHIMSSMIPVFLMPLAVCDSVHILSDFHEKYPQIKDQKQTIAAVYDELYKPLLFTSVTTAVGFANLAWAKIPPVRVFGLFVAFGVMAAWFLTITLIPAMLMFIKETRIEKFIKGREGSPLLGALGRFTLQRSKAVVIAGTVLLAIAIYGVSTLEVNDNPVKWFKKSHPIRVADDVLNEIIGGTYISYLTFQGNEAEDMKKPEVMKYIEGLQDYLVKDPLVGKTTSVADVVKRVNYVLHDEDSKYDVLPEEKETIGQYLFLFLMSSKPDELDNFVDYDFKKANMMVQLKSGDNKDMTSVVESVNRYMKEYPLPDGIKMEWSGLPYLNIIWQKLMVVGMLKAAVGSYWVVFLLLLIQFRSLWWAIVSMLPLSFSIIFTYAIAGFVGKHYDMPIAVCSTLTLGLGIDFAIHFSQRFRDKFRELKDLSKTMDWTMGGEPALAIARNAITVGIGFLPLVFATLGPYITVGLFFGSLALFAGMTTIVFLPSLIGTFRKTLLKT